MTKPTLAKPVLVHNSPAARAAFHAELERTRHTFHPASTPVGFAVEVWNIAALNPPLVDVHPRLHIAVQTGPAESLLVAVTARLPHARLAGDLPPRAQDWKHLAFRSQGDNVTVPGRPTVWLSAYAEVALPVRLPAMPAYTSAHFVRTAEESVQAVAEAVNEGVAPLVVHVLEGKAA